MGLVHRYERSFALRRFSAPEISHELGHNRTFHANSWRTDDGILRGSWKPYRYAIVTTLWRRDAFRSQSHFNARKTIAELVTDPNVQNGNDNEHNPYSYTRGFGNSGEYELKINRDGTRILVGSGSY